jgi:hypothetical protein
MRKPRFSGRASHGPPILKTRVLATGIGHLPCEPWQFLQNGTDVELNELGREAAQYFEGLQGVSAL